MANSSFTLEKERHPQPLIDDGEVAVADEPEERYSEDGVCITTVRFLTDQEVEALRDSVLHYDFMNP